MLFSKNVSANLMRYWQQLVIILQYIFVPKHQ